MQNGFTTSGKWWLMMMMKSKWSHCSIMMESSCKNVHCYRVVDVEWSTVPFGLLGRKKKLWVKRVNLSSTRPSHPSWTSPPRKVPIQLPRRVYIEISSISYEHSLTTSIFVLRKIKKTSEIRRKESLESICPPQDQVDLPGQVDLERHLFKTS